MSQEALQPATDDRGQCQAAAVKGRGDGSILVDSLETLHAEYTSGKIVATVIQRQMDK